MRKEFVVKLNSEYKYPIYDILEDGIGNCGAPRSKYETDEYVIMSEADAKVFYNDSLDKQCGDWKEITEERYNDMLGAVPPIDWFKGGFFMGELYMGDIGYFFQRLDGRYYESKQRTSYARDLILKGLKDFIALGMRMAG
ncbi:MAG: hypothetical protein LBC76_08225 [Treponema sp.]|jgi:hypothetical protein|nr:hypothetical protein [Treponema sp.]